jgi:hypothetical protein
LDEGEVSINGDYTNNSSGLEVPSSENANMGFRKYLDGFNIPG